MPKYTPTDEEMDSSYGSKPAPVGPPGEEESKPTPEKPSVDEENAGQQTVVISNKILSPHGEAIKEGDEIVLEVVKNYGDESEVKYAPKESGSAEEPETAGAAEDFAAMDTEKV
jgi:hypothetical protein